MGRRTGRGVVLLLAAVMLAACTEGEVSRPPEAVPRSEDSLSLAKPARAVAREAVGAVPQIVNPVEELLEFDPTGLLRWSAVAGADAYEVWAYSDEGLTQAAEFSGALESRQYQFTQLTGGQSYWIKLYFRANGVWQEAPTFAIKTALNVTKSRLINSQEELEAFGPSGTLRWTAVAGADVYELWIYRDTQLVAFAETSGPVRITQYQITSLTPGTTYYVQVYARVNGQYTNGGALPLTVTDQRDKARIVNPQEELDAFATNGMLRWSPVTGATAYELWIFTNPNVSEIHESSGSLTTRSYQTRTLQPGRVYYAQAYALVNGQWQVGAPVKITTTASPTKARLTTPQEQLEAFSTTGTLRWSEVPGATAYELWIYSNAGLGKIVESGANADRSHTVRRLCGGATYYVQVYALVNGTWTTGWATRLDVTQGTSAADCIPPAPVVKLTASEPDVIRGATVGLSWTTQFATSCSAQDAWSGSKSLSGQEAAGPVTGRSLFTLVCSGPSGTSLAQTLVGSYTVRHEKVSSYLSTPAAGHLWEVPVLVISYLPTADGRTIDVAHAPDFWWLNPLPLSTIQENIDVFNHRVKFSLEEGSRFRGYKDAGALPALGYRVVDAITVFETVPAGPPSGSGLGLAYQPDFHSIFQRLDVQRYVEQLGVKEIWFWMSGFDAGYPSFDPAIHFPQNARSVWESNMSSPTTGDVSNSNRAPSDLPVYDKTYIVYGYNFRRSQAEAVHNHGHQLEAQFSHVNFRQDGNTNLFWKSFVGQDQFGQFVTGRAGWTHMPPNTTQGYDYENPTSVSSDIEDWRPDNSGARTDVNVDTWGAKPYAWPGATDFHQRRESQWYIYWMQNMPGRDNGIRHGAYQMTNWWEFVGDWDGAIMRQRGLHDGPVLYPFSATSLPSAQKAGMPGTDRDAAAALVCDGRYQ